MSLQRNETEEEKEEEEEEERLVHLPFVLPETPEEEVEEERLVHVPFVLPHTPEEYAAEGDHATENEDEEDDPVVNVSGIVDFHEGRLPNRIRPPPANMIPLDDDELPSWRNFWLQPVPRRTLPFLAPNYRFFDQFQNTLTYFSVDATEIPKETSRSVWRSIREKEVLDLEKDETSTIQSYYNANKNQEKVILVRGSAAYAMSKYRLRDICTDANQIKYVCVNEAKTYVPHEDNVLINTPYLSLNAVGINAGMVFLSEIKYVIENTRELQILIIAKPLQEVNAIVSLGMLLETANARSSDHCQGGYKTKIYALKNITGLFSEPECEEGEPFCVVSGGKKTKGRRLRKRKLSQKKKHRSKKTTKRKKQQKQQTRQARRST